MYGLNVFGFVRDAKLGHTNNKILNSSHSCDETHLSGVVVYYECTFIRITGEDWFTSVSLEVSNSKALPVYVKTLKMNQKRMAYGTFLF